jgi:S-DNA-T family DNA segregation ATPase FtsK/SpoIIIE
MDLTWTKINETRAEIQNWASVLGAISAEMLINRWFGIASFVLLYLSIVTGLILTKARKISIWKAYFHTIFWLIWLSICMGIFVDQYFRDKLFFSLGGEYGDLISQWVISYIGMIGIVHY